MASSSSSFFGSSLADSLGLNSLASSVGWTAVPGAKEVERAATAKASSAPVDPALAPETETEEQKQLSQLTCVAQALEAPWKRIVPRLPTPHACAAVACALKARHRSLDPASASFKLAAKDALLEGVRGDLVAARRAQSLAEKEASTALAQLAQRESEVSSTHRALLKLDELRVQSRAQEAHLASLKAQAASSSAALAALQDDNARLKRALAAREAAARGSGAAAEPMQLQVAQGELPANAAMREAVNKMGDLTAQLASKEAQIHTLRGDLAAARRQAADSEQAALSLRRASSAQRAEVDAELSAARHAASVAAETACAAAQAPAGGRASTGAELSAAVVAKETQVKALRAELVAYRSAVAAVEEEKQRLASDAATLEDALLSELHAAKAAHEAAERSAAELANNAAHVMQMLSDQLTQERLAREAAEDVAANLREGKPEDALRPARTPRGSSGVVGCVQGVQTALLSPAVVRGLAAGLLCGFAARAAGGLLSKFGPRVTDRTGAGAHRAPRRQRAQREAPKQEYRTRHYN